MGKENKLNTRLKLLAIAVGLAWGGLAGAATLGNISILSGRGQPLQAEIELALADAAEADGLVVKVFAPEAYWNPGAALSASSLHDVSAHAEKRLNGSYVVKLASSSPVDTEHLALLAEVDSSAGKAVREYIAQWPRSLAPTAPGIKVDQAEAAGGVLVKSGDNLNKIALANKPADVSMERMLVALYRANPQAFSGKNMNRLQAGKVLRMPGSDELAAVTQSAARRDIHVQVADWNAYRRKVSGSLAEPDTEASDRQSSGKIGNAVSARDAADTSSHQEVLKLSKGDAPGAEKSAAEVKSLKDKLHAMEEDLIARDQALQESKDRIAMLEKNNREMQRLLELKSAVAPAASAAVAEPTETAVPPVEQSAVVVAEAVSAAAATEPASAVPAVTKSEPEVEVKPGANVAKYLWGGAALLLAGVGGWLFMRRGRKEKTTTKKPGAAAAAAAPVAAEALPETSELLVNTAIAEEAAEALVDVTHEAPVQVEREIEPTLVEDGVEDEPPVQISAAAMSLETAEDQAAQSAADLESGFAALDEPSSGVSAALDEPSSGVSDAVPEPFVAALQEEPVFEAEPESEEGAPAVDIAAEIPTFLAQPAVSEAVAAATSEPEIVLDGETEEPVAPLTTDDESPAVASQAATGPSDAAVASEVHEAPAAPVAGAEVELDIPTIADFTPPETASVPPLPGMEGVDLNLIDDTNLTEEELHAKGEQWLQVATKLDLARAYQEMGDDAGAREILEEVMAEGDAEQKTTAEQLLQMLTSA